VEMKKTERGASPGGGKEGRSGEEVLQKLSKNTERSYLNLNSGTATKRGGVVPTRRSKRTYKKISFKTLGTSVMGNWQRESGGGNSQGQEERGYEK